MELEGSTFKWISDHLFVCQPSSVKKPIAKPDINTSTNGPSTAKTKAPVVSSAGTTTVATSGTPVQTNPGPLKLKDQPMATLVTTTGMKVSRAPLKFGTIVISALIHFLYLPISLSNR